MYILTVQSPGHTYLLSKKYAWPTQARGLPGRCSAANQAAATGHYVERRVSVTAPVLAPQVLLICGGDGRADDL